MSKQPAVHFTHHVCCDPAPSYRDDDVQRRWRELYGSGVGNWPFTGCSAVRHRAKVGSILFTTDPAHVTCRYCQRQLDDGRVFTNGWHNTQPEINEHAEMHKRAWLTCCRHRGVAPTPEIEAEIASEQRSAQIAALMSVYAGLVPVTAARARELIDATVAKCGAEVRETFAPVITELTLITDWLSAIDECRARAERIMTSRGHDLSELAGDDLVLTFIESAVNVHVGHSLKKLENFHQEAA